MKTTYKGKTIEVKHDEDGFYAEIDGDSNGMPYYNEAVKALELAQSIIDEEAV